MKAIIYEQYGPPEVLKLQEVAQPQPQNNEVLIKVNAAEVTKGDCELRSFNFPVKWFWLPLRIAFGITKPKRQILGGYFSGEVVALGKEVNRFQKGDRVFGCAQLKLGAYGEYLCLPDNYTIVPSPHNMTDDEAAAVPLGGLNALHFLRKAQIQPGEKVLVNGAGGSIGTFGVQIAKSMGAEVTAVDSPIKEHMLKGIGADHFIDYTQTDYTQQGQTYDVILNMVANHSFFHAVKCLNSKGRYLLANPRLMDMFRSLLVNKTTDRTAIFAFAAESEEELLTLKEMIETGEIISAVDKIYPLDQIVDAHRRVETEERLGIIVLSMNTDL